MRDSHTVASTYEGDGSAEDMVAWALSEFGNDVVLACSFQYAVLVHMALSIRGDARIVAVDTGRLPEETYECAAAVERRYKTRIEWYFPETNRLEQLVRNEGSFSFRDGLDQRKRCCLARKVEPMNRALVGAKAWISGLRRDQSTERGNVPKISVDHAHGDILKICPLADWTERQVRDYTKKHFLPYNRLMENGYRSIGCACCTRAVEPGEDPRAGRWWWENPDNKECGLHVPNWSI